MEIIFINKIRKSVLFFGWILFDNAWKPGVYKWEKIIYLFPMSWLGYRPIPAHQYSLAMNRWGNDHA